MARESQANSPATSQQRNATKAERSWLIPSAIVALLISVTLYYFLFSSRSSPLSSSSSSASISISSSSGHSSASISSSSSPSGSASASAFVSSSSPDGTYSFSATTNKKGDVPSPTFPPPPTVEWPFDVKTLEKEEMTEDKLFLPDFVAEGKPKVLSSSPISRYWAAFSVLTPEWIKNTFPLKPFINVYKHDSNVFGPYWDESKYLSSLPSIKRRNAHQLANMTASEFVKEMGKKVGERKYNYYHSANINHFPELVPWVSPLTYCEVDPSAAVQNTNFWIGQAGTTADTHYDAYHNVNVQIYGRKRWLLLPPNSPLYLYPFFHPSHAQSQVLLHDANFTRFPRLSELHALQVIMEPGDVLYLPPNWFHRVEALDDSISVNCWSKSAHSDIANAAVQFPDSPLHEYKKRGWTQGQTSLALSWFATYLLEKLYPGSDDSLSGARNFVSELIDMRYRVLVSDGELPSCSDFYPKKSPEECLTRARDTLCPEDAFPRKDLKALKKEWSHAAERVADLFLQLPAEVRGVRVSDYLEFLGFAAVGTAKKISVYLEACVPQ